MKPAIYYTPFWILILIVIAIMSLTSCDPMKRATKRHERLVQRYPHVHQTDTVTIHDTVHIQIPKTEVDTVFLKSLLRDTVTITKERLKIKMYTVNDSIYVNGECDTITVEKIIERKIPVKYYETKPTGWKWLKWILICAFVLAMLFVLSKFKNNENN